MGEVRPYRHADRGGIIAVFNEVVQIAGTCIQGVAPLTSANLDTVLKGSLLVYVNDADEIAGMIAYRVEAGPVTDFMAVSPRREPNVKATYVLLCLEMCKDLEAAGHDHVRATLDARTQDASIRFLLDIGGIVQWRASSSPKGPQPVDLLFPFSTFIPNLKELADAAV